LAKSHHQFAKRQRELAKKKKKEEKRRRKLEGLSRNTEENPDETSDVVLEDALVDSVPEAESAEQHSLDASDTVNIEERPGGESVS